MCIRNNTIVGFRDGIYCDDRWDNVVENNTLDVRHYGVYSNNEDGDGICDDTITKSSSDWFICNGPGSIYECEALGGRHLLQEGERARWSATRLTPWHLRRHV